MAEQHATRSLLSLPTEPAGSAVGGMAERWPQFEQYVGNHDYSREQAIALLQLAVDTAEPGSAKKGARLEWQNIYAAIATLTRTDNETLHARLTIGFSPAEFKWMLQNKALYTWHTSAVRFQRCLQCMVAKLGTNVPTSALPFSALFARVAMSHTRDSPLGSVLSACVWRFILQPYRF